MSRHRRKLTRKQKITLKMKQKLALLFVVIVLVLLAVIIRLVYINRVSGERYTKKYLPSRMPTARRCLLNAAISMTGTERCLLPVRRSTI